MSAEKYFEQVEEVVTRLRSEQIPAIKQAAELIVKTTESGGSIFAFGASHSFMMAMEMVYRTGGFMLINPIYPHGMNLSVRPLTMTSRVERLPDLGSELLDGSAAKKGDVLLIFSTSGRNAVGIDMALHASTKGISVVGITAKAYTDKVTSRHPSGKKLVDICDIVIDNGAPYGDAAVTIEGFPGKVGPLSSVTGCAIANAIVSEAVDIMVKKGETPPVFMSANVDGGDEHNARLMKENAHRIHYM